MATGLRIADQWLLGRLLKTIGSRQHWTVKLGRHLPTRAISWLAGRLLATRWFSREIVINGWFLHANEPALECWRAFYRAHRTMGDRESDPQRG